MSKQTFTTGQVLTAAQMTSLQQTAMGGGSTTAKTASYVLVASDAGTVVQMNAAGATTITVNTALFAAGDSVQIQNIGAGVCTVTAGTATVSTAGSLALSQYEGGQLYFNTTSAALFFDVVQSAGMTNPMTTTGDIIYSSSGSTPARLGIGTTGQNLTVASGIPSWSTPASGMTLISATTFSGQSSQAFDAKFTSTYDVYLVFVSMYDNGVSADIKIQGRDSSNATIATNYTYAQNNLKYDGTASTNLGLGATSVNMGANGFSSTISQSMKFTFVKPLTTRVSFFWEGYSAGINGIINGAGQQTTTAFSGFILTPASSTISGTVYIYGLAK